MRWLDYLPQGLSLSFSLSLSLSPPLSTTLSPSHLSLSLESGARIPRRAPAGASAGGAGRNRIGSSLPPPHGSAAVLRRLPSTPLLSSPTAPSFHPLPSPPPQAWRRRRSRASTGRAGPGRAGLDFLHSLQRRRSCIARRRRRRASTVALACAVPRARRSRTRAAGGARGRRSAKLIKVYTWFAHWCAGARKGLLTVHIQFANNGEKFTLLTKSLHQRLRNSIKSLH